MLCNEFDSSLKALVNPEEQFRPIPGFPEICVMAFSAHIVEKCLKRYGGEQIADVPFCTGRVPIYRVVIDGTEVAQKTDLGTIIQQHSAGDTLSITVARGGQMQTVSLTLGEKNNSTTTAAAQQQEQQDAGSAQEQPQG